MIFFRVSENINIKTTDNTLVKYHKFKLPLSIENETVYISTFSDFNDLKKVFSNIDKDKYLAKEFKEDFIRKLEGFPTELGISNENENFRNKNFDLENNYLKNSERFYELEKVDIFKQLKNIKKDEIKIAFIGGVGVSISQIITSCTALRILYTKLSEIYKSVKFDIYIDASNNTFYSRDKQIYLAQNFINRVYPLGLNIKRFIQYDYFIDNSSFYNTVFFKQLNYVDAWLYKFGLDYENIPSHLKYSELDISNYEVKKSLKSKLENLKIKGKILLFHPYSANISKSIPQSFAVEILKQLVSLSDDYTVISTLEIEPRFKDDRYVDLSNESKTLNDFIYIISNMDKVITADTATYHISDSFMIPTVVLFRNDDAKRKTKYYDFVKVVEVKDESKNLSKFIFENDDLTLYKFESWKKLKVEKIIKLLETF